VKPCDKAYLYASSLKKHIQVSHPEEYDTLIKTNKGNDQEIKEREPLCLSLVSKAEDKVIMMKSTAAA